MPRRAAAAGFHERRRLQTGDSSKVLVVPDNAHATRADKLLAECFGNRGNRSWWAKLIKLGRVLVGGVPIRASFVLSPGDLVEILEEPPAEARADHEASPPFTILFEDSDLVVVDKPAGLVVHPGAGRPGGTLMDALVADRPQMIGVGEPGRWGVVHRLDRDTSGVMVAAKTDLAHASLSGQFKEHTVHRIYLALVRGNPGAESGTVDAPLGRHSKDRKRISTAATATRTAVTMWHVNKRLGSLTLLEIKPKTGRTHQIRAHLASVGLPVLGDAVYGSVRGKARIKDALLRQAMEIMKRQALHAAVLGFTHPVSSEYVEFKSPLPSDMLEMIELAEESGRFGGGAALRGGAET